MTHDRPVVLVVDDVRPNFDRLLLQLQKFDNGRLSREFEFIYAGSYHALRNWYRRNPGRFVSLILQDVDFSQVQDRRQLIASPPEWRPGSTGFDQVGLQGIIIYHLLRNENLDVIAPVLFVSSPTDMQQWREFAEYIVHPGLGFCAFIPETAQGERYYPELIRSIDELALRPLTETQRQHWREIQGMVVGHSRRMAYLCYDIDRIAPSEAIVLLMGEPGVGKELVARAIHRKSGRYKPDDPKRQRPWTVNIAALEKNLVEDELFGHFRGAYTDASTNRMGIFEAADGSTVFLDEIGDLSKEVQLKLLRVMEYREIKKLGSSQEMHVDNRIIAATNRSPAELFRNARPDFIGRLVQHCLIVPGLRTRWDSDSPRVIEDDIQELIAHFLHAMNRDRPAPERVTITDVAVRFVSQSVCEYIAGSNLMFTNNVRTIRNIVERAFERALAQHKRQITLGEIIATLGMIKLIHRGTKLAETPATMEQMVGSLDLAQIERRAIAEALRKTPKLAEAARLLGIHRDTLRRKMSDYEITDAES
jgi:transcriptional regulator with GAF, ATPase, and Fis domain